MKYMVVYQGDIVSEEPFDSLQEALDQAIEYWGIEYMDSFLFYKAERCEIELKTSIKEVVKIKEKP